MGNEKLILGHVILKNGLTEEAIFLFSSKTIVTRRGKSEITNLFLFRSGYCNTMG